MAGSSGLPGHTSSYTWPQVQQRTPELANILLPPAHGSGRLRQGEEGAEAIGRVAVSATRKGTRTDAP